MGCILNNNFYKMLEIKELDQKGLDFLINEEGLVLHPYLDSVGIPTIGVGCTYYENGTKVKMTDSSITKDRAISLFKNLLNNYELGVYSVTRDDINQNQFNALVSFTYNEGVNAFKHSTLLEKINLNPDDNTITHEFLQWERAGSDPKRLESRRIHEAKLYFTK